jgi:hypothetical protein
MLDQKQKTKLLSGRLIILVMSYFTYCLCMVGITIMTMTKVIAPDVFLALFAGLTGLVTLIGNSYFQRTDRNNENIEQPKN